MRLTAIEKIISNKSGKTVKAGDITIADVDFVMAQDGNAPLAINLLKNEYNTDQVFNKDKVALVIDHCGPAPNEGAANLQQIMRNFAKKSGVHLYDAGEGISHVLLPEKGHAQPGRLIIGSDSHTVTYGAVNCFGTGMGSTDITTALHTGKVWLRVPETIKITLNGKLKGNVTGKDLTLHIIKKVGVSGATYKCLEIDGEGLASLNMDNRFTLCNMAIEMGAKCAIMPVDNICRNYLDERLDIVPDSVWSDPECNYYAEYVINLDEVEPLIALPHNLTKIVPVNTISEQKIDIAFIGTCTNGRISDLEAAAKILENQKVHPNVRLIITPGSREVYKQAINKGLMDIFINAGAIITPPGCGACIGTHLGIPGDGEVVISTANRNFQGRMGNRNATIFLGSPDTVAASAIEGEITSKMEISIPREVIY